MPNWAKGEIRIRGNQENVKKFILEGLEEVSGSIFEEEIKPIKKDEYDIVQYDCVHICNTFRGFIDDLFIDLNFTDDFDDRDKKVYISCKVRFEWGCKIEEIQEIAKKFNIDIRMYLFEAGMQFNRDIEIIDGEILKDSKIQYNNYVWECIMPNLGG